MSYTRFEVGLFDGALAWWEVLFFVPLILWSLVYSIWDEARNGPGNV